MNRKIVTILTVAALFGGCAAHSPMIVKSTVDVDQTATAKAESHQSQVFFPDAALPANVKYELLGEINIGKAWYGDTDPLLSEMADKARELGADAVIEVGTWKQPSGFAWAAPHATGKAVKILNKDSIDLKAIPGKWR